MKKILIQFAHPAKKKSTMNIALKKAVEDLENVKVNDLYANYPDFFIDVEKEQSLCEEHDIIVFQHPFYWYSTPAILKEWQDLVLEHDWAYGSKGNALEGKYLFQVLTAGGDEVDYSKEGLHKVRIPELVSPLKAMANLCKLEWIPPYAILGNHRGLDAKSVAKYASNYREIIKGLRDESLDMKRLKNLDYINSDIKEYKKED